MKRKTMAIIGIALALGLAFCAGIWLSRSGAAGIAPIKPQAERDFVQANLTYDEGTRTLRGTQSMTLTNRTGAALEEIVLRAYMNGQDGASVSVTGAKIDGEAVTVAQDEDDPTVLRAAVQLAAGETAELSFTLMIKHAKTEGAALIQLPVLAMHEDGAWRTDAYDDLADPSYAEAFDVSIRVDEAIAAQMRGARDASFAMLPRGRTRSGESCGVQVMVLAQDASGARQLMTQTKAALESLEAIGLEYPFESLTVAQGDTGREDGLALSGLVLLDADGSKEETRRKLTRLIARETFGILVESDPWAEPWLSYTLSSAAEMLAYRGLKGQTAYEERLYGDMELSTRLTRPYGVTVGAGTASFGGDAEMTQVLRDQGASMLLGIGQAVGEDTLIAALQYYTAQHAGKTAVKADFAAALREMTGSSWDGYLEDGLSY